MSVHDVPNSYTYLRSKLQLYDSLTPRPMIQLVLSCQLVPVALTGLILVTSILV